jgi:hypothetical protein
LELVCYGRNGCIDAGTDPAAAVRVHLFASCRARNLTAAQQVLAERFLRLEALTERAEMSVGSGSRA